MKINSFHINCGFVRLSRPKTYVISFELEITTQKVWSELYQWIQMVDMQQSKCKNAKTEL